MKSKYRKRLVIVIFSYMLLWFRSLYWIDEFHVYSASPIGGDPYLGLKVRSGPGLIILQFDSRLGQEFEGEHWRATLEVIRYSEMTGDCIFGENVIRPMISLLGDGSLRHYRSDSWQYLTGLFPPYNLTPSGMRKDVVLFVPYWTIWILLMSLLIWNYHIKHLFFKENLFECPACGYDLRATSERCPECGRETSQAEREKILAVAKQEQLGNSKGSGFFD